VVNTLFCFGTYHLVFVLYDHISECSYNIISEDAAEFTIFFNIIIYVILIILPSYSL